MMAGCPPRREGRRRGMVHLPQDEFLTALTRLFGATRDKGSLYITFKRVPVKGATVAEGEQPPVEARATGPKQTGLEPSSWDDGEELEPETDHDGKPLPPRNVLMTRCRHTQPTRLHSRQPASSLPCAPVAAGASKSTSSTRACTS